MIESIFHVEEKTLHILMKKTPTTPRRQELICEVLFTYLLYLPPTKLDRAPTINTERGLVSTKNHPPYPVHRTTRYC